MPDRISAAAVVVCGGQSTRMGSPKALLPFGSEAMVQRIVRIVREALAGPIVVVAAPGQTLPMLPAEVAVVIDEREGRGPLEGLCAGLKRLSGHGDVAFATGCDVPLLRPAFVRRVCECLRDHDAAVPQTDGYLHPLAAAYRIDVVLPQVEALLAADRLRPAFLFDLVKTRVITESELREVDPSLDSLRNLNTPAEYEAALRDAEFA